MALMAVAMGGMLACGPQSPEQIPAAAPAKAAQPLEDEVISSEGSGAAAQPVATGLAPAVAQSEPPPRSAASNDGTMSEEASPSTSAGGTPDGNAAAGPIESASSEVSVAEVPPAKPGKTTAFWAGSGKRQDKASWTRLAKDGLHDVANPALPYLQNPREALAALPTATSGNYVDWVAALRAGVIQPRATARSSGAMNLLDLDVAFPDTKNMPAVLFPHLSHTEWLDCKDCHDGIFVAKRGANPIAMADIMGGKACGRCHGRVAFPLNQCFVCHSGKRPGQSQPASGP